jgi:5-methylcytosine-specific restriction endonuclease McrA
MMPFDAYPHGGRKLIGRPTGSNCRHEYGLKLQKLAGLHACAYCGMSLVDTYEHWLMMSVDHVVPTRAGQVVGISDAWLADYANIVLCCSACNGFGNRYKLMPEMTGRPATLDEFFALRDRVFADRKALILLSHEKERAFYDKKPWS